MKLEDALKRFLIQLLRQRFHERSGKINCHQIQTISSFLNSLTQFWIDKSMRDHSACRTCILKDLPNLIFRKNLRKKFDFDAGIGELSQDRPSQLFAR